MKSQTLILPALVLCASLLQRIHAEDDTGYLNISKASTTVAMRPSQTKDKITLQRILSERREALVKMLGHQTRAKSRSYSGLRLNNKANANLKWVKWSGSLPQWAVKVYISKTKREDYICAPHTSCYWSSGYYNPTLGPFCFNPCHGKEVSSSEFDILVNEKNLELLEWKAFDSDFNNMVTSFANGPRVYVGKSISGIGAITEGSFIISDNVTIRFSPKRNIFYLPSGTETRHLKGFDVLTQETAPYKQRIHDVQYLTDDLSVLSEEPIVFDQMTVENRNVRDIEQEVTLKGKFERQSTWETDITSALAMSASLETMEPSITYPSVVVLGSELKTVTNGNSITETIPLSLTLKVNALADHSCSVKLVGKKYVFNIPYKAQLSKEFTNGRVHNVTVSGTYKGVQVGEIKDAVERCTNLPTSALPETDRYIYNLKSDVKQTKTHRKYHSMTTLVLNIDLN